MRQSQQDTQRPLLTWPKRTNVLFLKTLFYLHTLLKYKDFVSFPCLKRASLFHFFDGTTVILKENQVSVFFTLIETEERGPRVGQLFCAEGKASGMRTRCVPPGCNTTFFLSAARSLFLIRPSVLSRRLKLTGSRTRRFRAFAFTPPPCLRSYSSGRLLAA